MPNLPKAVCWASALIVLALLSRIVPDAQGSFDAAFYGVLALSVVSLSRDGQCGWRKARS